MDANFYPELFLIYQYDHMTFILQFLMECIMLIDLWILNYPCFPGNKSHLIMVYDSFNVLLN